LIARGEARDHAILQIVDQLEADTLVKKRALKAAPCVFYDTRSFADLNEEAANVLRDSGAEALLRGPYSVTDKPSPGPSGDLHNYYSVAPFWWPRKFFFIPLPSEYRDGQRIAGTLLHDSWSHRYDRTRLQRLFDDTTLLALNWRIFADTRAREHALRLIYQWFIHPESRMNENLNFAQVQLGGRKGRPSGIIESKDFYFFLDAVKMLGDSYLNQEMRQWCQKFMIWLTKSQPGKEEQFSSNNHGTCYDLQLAAHAAFLDDLSVLQEVNFRAQARLLGSTLRNGDQVFELTRAQSQHYYTFNAQSWINLFTILEGVGFSPWESQAGERLLKVIERLLTLSKEGWPFEQRDHFDPDRLAPIARVYQRKTGQSNLEPKNLTHIYHPHFGIAPFWYLS
jgi:hypothetical protein